MKKHKSLFLTMFAIFSIVSGVMFTSCGDDDDDLGGESISQENVIGTWKNAESGITLIVTVDGATYESNTVDLTLCDWSIGNSWMYGGDYLEVSQVNGGISGLLKAYVLKNSNTLEDAINETLLTKE